jgi:hypothetical protein
MMNERAVKELPYSAFIIPHSSFPIDASLTRARRMMQHKLSE